MNFSEHDRRPVERAQKQEVNPVDLFIAKVTENATNRFRGTLLEDVGESSIEVAIAQTNPRDQQTLRELDKLQDLLATWTDPYASIPLEPILQQHNYHEERVTLRLKPKGIRLPGAYEFAQSQLNFSLDLGEPETISEAIHAVSLRSPSHRVVERLEVENRDLKRKGKQREATLDIHTVDVYQDWQTERLHERQRSGVRFKLEENGEQALAQGLIFIGKKPFTSDLFATISSETFATMGNRITEIARSVETK